MHLFSTSDIPLKPEIFKQLVVVLDPVKKILWVTFNCSPRPTFNSACLDELLLVCEVVKEFKDSIKYVVTQSKHPSAFNLGGDLDMFANKIEAQNKESLTQYAHKCIEIIDQFNNGFYQNVITIANVAGSALGGGFEFALSHNFIVAKNTAKMGFPEINFGLFPGMGAYSFFKRKSEGTALVEKMILSGDSLSADVLYNKGVVDVVYIEDQMPAMVENFINNLSKKIIGVDLLIKNRQIVSPITKEVLYKVTDLWVEGALKLSPANIRYMRRLVYFQDKANSSCSGN